MVEDGLISPPAGARTGPPTTVATEVEGGFCLTAGRRSAPGPGRRCSCRPRRCSTPAGAGATVLHAGCR
ncbi:hypothetical protein HBB16_14710 [Pseudonocardia sp. MCCB 268]|nr:hypothetical protein [Pseudonocardia cytotoxica]